MLRRRHHDGQTFVAAPIDPGVEMSDSRSRRSIGLRGVLAAAVALFVLPSTGSAQVVPVDMNAPSDPDPIRAIHDLLWHAWFAADTSRLRQLMAEDFTGLNAGDTRWSGRDAVLSAATDFADAGRAVAITFPACEQRNWGIVASLFCLYVIDIEQGHRLLRIQGRSTEIFVATPTGWVAAAWHMEGR